MLHHVSLGVSRIEKAAEFYDAVFTPLGFVRVWEDIRPGEADQAVGYGQPGEGDKFALKSYPDAQSVPRPGFHLAFAAPSRLAVDQFFDAAIAHGGVDNGAPGLRPNYGPHYYAAFIVDLDGHHIEAVCKEAP